MLRRNSISGLALAGVFLMTVAGAQAFDETKYPDWSGQWRKPQGIGNQWDQTKPTRRIYTDGRAFPKDEEATWPGYSIGKWLDTDNDGRFDTLEVETRNFKGPRIYEASGIPLHRDNESIVKERITLDKENKDLLRYESTSIDHARTRPWTVM